MNAICANLASFCGFENYVKDGRVSHTVEIVAKVALGILLGLSLIYFYDPIGSFLRTNTISFPEVMIIGGLSAFCALAPVVNPLFMGAQIVGQIALQVFPMVGVLAFSRAWSTGFRAILEEKPIALATGVTGFCALLSLGYELFSPEILFWIDFASENSKDAATHDRLAKCYEEGNGTDKDLPKAFEHYWKVLEAENVTVDLVHHAKSKLEILGLNSIFENVHVDDPQSHYRRAVRAEARRDTNEIFNSYWEVSNRATGKIQAHAMEKLKTIILQENLNEANLGDIQRQYIQLVRNAAQLQ